MEDVLGRAEAVVGRDDDRRVGARVVDDAGEQPVERAEVIGAQVDQLLFPGGRVLRPAGGVDEPPAEVLELVDAVEHDPDQVGLLLLHQVAADLGPAPLAADVELDPLDVLLLGAAVDRLDLHLHVEHLARLERLELLEALEQSRRDGNRGAAARHGIMPPGTTAPLTGGAGNISGKFSEMTLRSWSEARLQIVAVRTFCEVANEK